MPFHEPDYITPDFWIFEQTEDAIHKLFNQFCVPKERMYNNNYARQNIEKYQIVCTKWHIFFKCL